MMIFIMTLSQIQAFLSEGQVSSESHALTEERREQETSPEKTNTEFIKPTLPPPSLPPNSPPPPSLPPPSLPPPRPPKRPTSLTGGITTVPEASARQESGQDTLDSSQPAEKRPLEVTQESSEVCLRLIRG